MRRIIVTGGAGFVGANLVRQLEHDHPDARIVVIDDLRTGVFSNLTDGEAIMQPYVSMDKGADAGLATFDIDYVRVWSKRTA